MTKFDSININNENYNNNFTSNENNSLSVINYNIPNITKLIFDIKKNDTDHYYFKYYKTLSTTEKSVTYLFIKIFNNAYYLNNDDYIIISDVNIINYTNIENQKSIIIKKIKKSNGLNELDIYKYINKMNNTSTTINQSANNNNNNILQCYGWIDTPKINKNEVYLLLEYCQYGNLKEFLHKYMSDNNIEAKYLHSNQSYIKLIDNIIIQILNGMVLLEKMNIVHNDIKIENIFVKYNDHINIKIGDFDLSWIKTNKIIIGGTPYYVSPEIIYKIDKPKQNGENNIIYQNDTFKLIDQNSTYYKVDVWAFGVLYIYLYSQSYPFYAKYRETLFKKIKNNKYKIRYKNLQKFIESHNIFTKDIDKRPTLLELQNQIIKKTNKVNAG